LEGNGRGPLHALPHNIALTDENTKPVRVDAPFKNSVGYRPNTSVQRNLCTIHIGVGHVEGCYVPNYSGELNDTNGRNLALTSNNTMFTQGGI
jgi:hypothetical protein